MINKNESWLDALTNKDVENYMKKVGLTQGYSTFINDKKYGKYVAISGIKNDGKLFQGGMGQYAPIKFFNRGVKEDFSKMFEEKDGQIQITEEASLWLNLVSSKNEGRIIADESCTEHNYLDSFVYNFIKEEGFQNETNTQLNQNKYENEKVAIAELYNNLSDEKLTLNVEVIQNQEN